METPVRPIYTEEEYDAALALADKLMAAAPGTRDGDHLDALVASINTYEADQWAIDPPSRRTLG